MGPLQLFLGERDLGKQKSSLIFFLSYLVSLSIVPMVMGDYEAMNFAYFLLNVPLGLSVTLVWGYCGILSFGQIAFFGVAGYAYGIIAGNLTQLPAYEFIGIGGGILSSMLLASILAYFLFFARVENWIIPVLTLVFTLLLETFLAQTAGYQWKIGNVLLGGYNGMTGIPSMRLPWIDDPLYGYSFYYYVLTFVALVFVALRIFINSKYGSIIVAIREDSLRTEVLGYDIRKWQFFVFVLAAALASVSGILYVQWGNYITPSQLGLVAAAQPVIWAAIGGRSSLLAVSLSTIGMTWFSFTLSTQGNQLSLIFIGAAAVASIMLFRDGIVLTLWNNVGKLGKLFEKK